MSAVWLYPIDPSSAPRQSRSDKWKPSAPVQRYRAYKDELKLKHVHIPKPFHHFIFLIPMAPSWPTHRKLQMEGKPHEQKPDRDNLEKAVLDALLPDSDCMIWNGSTSKVWSQHGGLIVANVHVDIDADGIEHGTMMRIYTALRRWHVGQPAFPHQDESGPYRLHRFTF